MILLVGGLGNVGINVYNKLISQGKKVVVMGRQAQAKINKLYPNIEYIENNVVENTNWNIGRDFECVVNLAYGKQTLANNVIKDNKKLISNLYENCKSSSIFHISTTAINGYGNTPLLSLTNQRNWDDFYTLGKSVQEQEIYRNSYPIKVVRIANFLDKDSMFLKALSILTQIKINESDFTFPSDITTTDDVIQAISSDKEVLNLYPEVNPYWSDLIKICKNSWEISDKLHYKYDHFFKYTDKKSSFRYVTKLVPKSISLDIITFIKRNDSLLNLFQNSECVFNYIAPVFRVARNDVSLPIYNQNNFEKIKNLISSLNENSLKFRIL